MKARLFCTVLAGLISIAPLSSNAENGTVNAGYVVVNPSYVCTIGGVSKACQSFNGSFSVSKVSPSYGAGSSIHLKKTISGIEVYAFDIDTNNSFACNALTADPAYSHLLNVYQSGRGGMLVNLTRENGTCNFISGHLTSYNE